MLLLLRVKYHFEDCFVATINNNFLNYLEVQHSMFNITFETEHLFLLYSVLTSEQYDRRNFITDFIK